MNWIRQRHLHLIGTGFFFVFDFIFYYPRVVLQVGLPISLYFLICLVFALHIWFFNYFMVYLVHRLYPQLQHNIQKRLLVFLLLLPVSVLLTSFFQSLFFSLLNNSNSANYFYLHYEDVGMNLLYSLIIIFFLELMHYFRHLTKALLEAAALKQQNTETQLNSLKNQVNPHFLFNSLNSLSSLILSNPTRAVTFVHKLAGVYRYLLQSKDQDLITLKEELTFLNAYLHLLQTRFGKALASTLTIDPAYECYFIPPITLQLLLENAVKHNIVSDEHPLLIEVYTADGRLVVKNNLQKRKTPVASHRIGLVNIISKYKLLTAAEVEIMETGEAFTVSLPLLKTNIYDRFNHRR